MSAKIKGVLSAGRPSAGSDIETLTSLVREEKPKTELKRVNFDVLPEHHTKLKVYAAKRGKTVRELLTEFVEQLPNE